jgi:enamine deaminase RidA (YjgF/YER057c/UK114 family)
MDGAIAVERGEHVERVEPGNEPGNEIVTAPELGEPVGYAHAVVGAPGGRLVFLGGQTALGPDGAIVGETLVEQFAVAASNVVCALRAAGGAPDDICSMQIFVTDPADYKRALPEFGRVWREHFGRRYPATGLFGVTRLFDDEALVELMATAVIPPGRAASGGAPAERSAPERLPADPPPPAR